MEEVIVFAREDIQGQMKKILNSPVLKNSATLSRFLSFIVTETVEGRQQQIKEYSIAVNVLNRPADFKPHDDAVVRIHAGRLRRALNEYYLIEGLNDPIFINIPKGCYVPQFEANTGKPVKIDSTVSPDRRIKPVLAIFPFRTLPKSHEMEEFSLILGEQLGAVLSHFHNISVIGYYSNEVTERIEKNILEAGRTIGADYIATGSFQFYEEKVLVTVNIIRATTGEIIVGETFERQFESRDFGKIHHDIVNLVVDGITSYSPLFPGNNQIVFR